MKTIEQLANEAVLMQDACNGLAIARAYGAAVTNLRDALAEAGEPTDTDSLRSHPIKRLWASKIHDLSGMGVSNLDRFSDAYQWCLDRIKPTPAGVKE